MPRARRFAFFFASAVAVCATGGCTFLVSFDDVPSASDAGASPRDAGPDRRDTGATIEDAGGVDAADAAPKVPETPPCDTSFALSSLEGCSTFNDGAQVCADSSKFTSYPGNPSTDVVTCSKSNGATCVRHCVACAHNPNGFPDQCDQCSLKPDGKYCGSDMGWQSTNDKLLVTCSGGKMSSSAACGVGCSSNGGMGKATCQ